VLDTVFGIVTIALAIVVSSAPLQSGTSVTGIWAGPLTVTVDGKATEEEEYVHVVLKQAGEVVTGTAGENADQQFPIRNGRLTTVRDVTMLTFEFIANGVQTSFSLKAIDGLLKGDARIVGEDGHAYAATAELKPVRKSHSVE
jgi:hypothetical protein